MTRENAAVVRALLERYPRSHADELGIDCAKNTPQPLFQWLVVSTLLSARISSDLAMAAARALFDAGWDMPDRLCDAGWKARVRVLNESGYARYDESTSRYLGDSCERLLERYGGDLRRLREEADGDADAIRKGLKGFKGIGDVGADIFCREAQMAWDELYPLVDDRAATAAGNIGLPESAEGLAGLVGRRDLPRLLSALIRMDLDNAGDAVREAARNG